MTKAIEATAYHEAGHAVIRLHLELGFRRVTIIPDDDHLGAVECAPPPRWFNPDIEITPRGERWIDSTIVSSLAGPEAEFKFVGRRNNAGARGDRRWACELASYMFDGVVLKKYMAYMAERARATVGSPLNWSKIEAVAKALLERGALTQGEVRSVCLSALRLATHASGVRI